MSEANRATPVRLSDLTTLRLGGPAAEYVEATTEAALVAAVRDADERGVPVLLVSGGSNLVVSDAGFDGLVVRVATRGIVSDVEPGDASCGGAVVTVAAGENWDDFVALAVASGWSGVEALSGIPGAVGSTPVQNVGAYGQEVASTIVQVRTWDRREETQKTFSAGDCEFSYRHSRFKSDPERYVILEVTFQLPTATLSAPVAYGELARALDVEVGERAPAAQVREKVLGLRRGKGMVLDAADHDSWSAGSFFTNPFLDTEAAASLPEEAPRYPQSDGRVKSSAAWLIQHAGFEKGFSPEGVDGRVSLSTKHTLALTNRGSGTTDDLLVLARAVRDGVEERFGVRLVNEPVFVGVRL